MVNRKPGFQGALVKALRPTTTTSGFPNGRSNVYAGLYLYQVIPNTAWRNDFSPVRRSDGSAVRGTRSAFDLYYLVTFYGDESKMEPQRILGCVVRKVASEPILTTDMIKNAKTGALVNSNLETEVERVEGAPICLFPSKSFQNSGRYSFKPPIAYPLHSRRRSYSLTALRALDHAACSGTQCVRPPRSGKL